MGKDKTNDKDDEQQEIRTVVETHTGDGPGDEDPGESDFLGYADPEAQQAELGDDK